MAKKEAPDAKVLPMPDGPPDATGPDPAPAEGARDDQGLHRAARLPAQHARDRHRRRPDQLLQRRPPAQDARGEGLPAARPQPAARAGGLPARGDGGTPLDVERRRVVVRRDRHRRHRARRRPTSRCWAGSPPVARSWPRSRIEEVFPLPKQLVGEGTLFLLEVSGDSMIDAAICRRRLRRDPPGADRRQRRHRRRADRRRGHGQDVAAQGRQGLAAPAQRQPTTRSTAPTPRSWAWSPRSCAACEAAVDLGVDPQGSP